MRKSLLLVLVLLPISAAIATPDAELDSGLDTLVVTATRIPTPEVQIASSVTLISADEIAARQLRTLPDLLQTVPGLNVVQTGGPGGQTSVFIRGTNSNHTKVLVDGIDVSDPSNSGGAFNLGQFLTEDIQKVEVLRGPQSGLYGSDAIGGVINIITKSGSGPAQFAAGIEAGSFNTFNQAASVSGSLDQFHYAANLQHFHAGSTPVTPLDLLPAGQPRIDDYDDNLTLSTKLGYDLTEHWDLGLVARYTDAHLRITGENYVDFPTDVPDSTQSENNTVQYYTRAIAHWAAPSAVFDQTLGAAYSNIKSSNFSPNDFNPPEIDRSDLFGERVKFDWQGIVRLAAAQQLVLGVEHQRDEITQPASASITINSLYTELQSGFSERLYDTVSVRYDHNDQFGGEVTYRIAPVYLLSESDTKLKGSIGTGFKAPTLIELYQNLPEFGFVANPNLKPESSLGWDLGFEQSLMNKTVEFGATYFHNYIKNLIAENAEFTTNINIGRAVTDGVEAFVAYQPMQTLDLRLDYTYTEARDEVLQLELLRRPKNKVSLTAAWQAMSRLSVNASVLSVSSWVDGNRDFSILRLNAPGYTVANLASEYALTNRWTLLARVTNLFNRHYQNPDGFDQPTVGAYAGIKAKF